jgi:hypothetical protein
MSLGIACKGTEGVVLAADSRVTLMGLIPGPNGQQVMVPSTFDNATKLLQVKSQQYVGAVTYGAGAIGQQEPRTASSFLPEFEEKIANKGRLSVQDFAQELSKFFMDQWRAYKMPDPCPAGNEMVFLVAGYDEGSAYGRVFELSIPTMLVPVEKLPAGMFGALWGGQREIVDRIIQGFDPRTADLAQDLLKIPTGQRKTTLSDDLRARLTIAIPWQFLPLQDCVDLSVFLIRATISLQQWLVGVRGVGGAIDVATITRTDGFRAIQVKQITGDKTHILTSHNR